MLLDNFWAQRERTALTRGETSLVTNLQPDGWQTVFPSVFTADVPGVVGFLKLVFSISGEMRTGAPAEMRIGDSLILVSDGGGARGAQKPSSMPMRRIPTRPINGRSRPVLLP